MTEFMIEQQPHARVKRRMNLMTKQEQWRRARGK